MINIAETTIINPIDIFYNNKPGYLKVCSLNLMIIGKHNTGKTLFCDKFLDRLGCKLDFVNKYKEFEGL